MLDLILSRAASIIAVGGPVVVLLGLMSVAAVAVTLWKLWQFSVLRVGRNYELGRALAAWDISDKEGADAALGRSKSHLAPVIRGGISAMNEHEDPDVIAPRLYAEAGSRLARLEGGFRALDSIAQIAPLLGLFGTVIGMIEAFRAMQGAGGNVDPAVLAGGIWVALVTTAVGLAIAMPTTAILVWLEGIVARERSFADKALQTVLSPGIAMPEVARRAA